VILSDGELWQAIKDSELDVELPAELNKILIQPSSIDLRLAPSIWVHPREAEPGEAVNPTTLRNVTKYIRDHTTERILAPDQPFLLRHGDFVIGETAETIRLSRRLAARVEGKSKLARFGVAVHITAPKIDPGFHNPITLEIINLGPFDIQLFPNMEIAVLIVERLGQPANQVYEGQFTSK
jgi:dCTP deaminase